MKFLICSVLLIPSLALASSAEDVPPVTPEHLSILAGDDWAGSLTYLNYGEPVQDFTIPAELDVEPVENGLKLSYQYPEEPDQNSIMVAKIKDHGRTLSGAKIIGHRVRETGEREIVTEYGCQDMGRSATCQMVYQISASEFRTRKMVTYANEGEAFRRSAYVFTR